MSESPGEGAEAVLAAARAVLGMMVRSLSPALESVRLEDYAILAVLASRGPLDRREIAELTGASPLAVDESMRRLMSTARADERTSRLSATSRGRALVDEVSERQRAEIAHLLGRLTAPERRTLADAARIVTTRTGEPAPEQLIVLGL